LLRKALILFAFGLITYQLGAQNVVRITTTEGEVLVSLYSKTPIHRSNFKRLANEGFYDSTSFHRIISEFMIQGGDPKSKPSSKSKRVGSGGPGYTLQAELKTGYIHKKGALAAARDPDDINPSKRSNGSQFYIVVGRKYPRKYLTKFEEENGVTYSEEDKLDYERLGGTPHLDGNYTVFGEVIKGMDIVEKISNVKTGKADRPIEPVYIIKMEVIQ